MGQAQSALDKHSVSLTGTDVSLGKPYIGQWVLHRKRRPLVSTARCVSDKCLIGSGVGADMKYLQISVSLML